MSSDVSMNNISFNFLKNSSEFLQVVLANINSCVLLLDRNMKLVAFNDALTTIFSNKKDEDLLYMRCGEAIGCAYQIEEKTECGSTSKCNSCELRISALLSLTNEEVIYKQPFSKPFINYKNEKIDKHLQFSSRLFKYDKDKYVMLIIEDVSELINLKNGYSA